MYALMEFKGREAYEYASHRSGADALLFLLRRLWLDSSSPLWWAQDGEGRVEWVAVRAPGGTARVLWVGSGLSTTYEARRRGRSGDAEIEEVRGG